MDKKEAKRILKAYSRICIETTRHCRERMFERQVTIDDLKYVIEWGEIEEIEETPDYGGWKCRIQGTDVDGFELIFIAAFSENSVRCITVF